MVKEVIFDCFGVLTEDGWLAFLRRFDNGSHSEELRYINYQFDRGSMSYQEFLNEACRLTEADIKIADKIIMHSHHVNKPLFDYAIELKSRGLSLGVISNVGSGLDTFLPGADLSIFDNITLSYEAGAVKPDPLIFETHLTKSAHQPNEVVFIDDRRINCEGAALLGMATILYKDFNQVKTDLETLLDS